MQNSRNPARLAHKNCVHPASVRYKYCTTSLRVGRVSIAFKSESYKRPASGSRNFCAQLARKFCIENFRKKKSARRAHKNCVKSASVVAQSAELRCSFFLIRRAFECKITRESSVEMTQIVRKTHAKILQNFRESGTPRAKKLHALGQRALCILHDVAER